ncbi:2-keto-3-deoxy-D-arabino-heptulosonate-7-phosphate synthase I beta [Candidatus Syntrophocurvum alkaliphilum]|uniref:2-keto-3-deoxy-D-arabino-heptulosonate-7-phosphate synthase I beta n=1 Tax=Candidatus Syntrophocurvum alkaliphilum TaxID=2293317 RepID=A0A6I6DJ79_9FIRM|nr:3-deoxy-7-phosphoheptulonate synthase [Candidatus Syntrophocurvum alkaliphilum]QGT99864.1 2-keto-3-deoxy-D-arabino-heptulosonate-7-phosphate synthase I beta [Candidatus Syntrophocurvum alkaliphilum]
MKPFRLASREYRKEDSIVIIPATEESVSIGEGYCTIIAGPCAVENADQYIDLACTLKSVGVHILRGGLFKPRTSPYSFKGLGIEGLEIMEEAKKKTGLPIITEIMDIRELDFMYNTVDILQIGSRNMQNFSLLEEIGKVDKPILLKRGLSATIEEWLLAAEYVLNGGNTNLILCERGIRTFEPYTRNTVDIGAIPLIKELSHLPIIVDPSHATGKWKMVGPVSRAAIAAGADGIMVEVHPEPDRALSDGKQSLTPENYKKLYSETIALAKLGNKKLK